MTQTTMQFDAVKAEKAKRRGMDFAAAYRAVALEDAREKARELARKGPVTVDMIYFFAEFDATILGNAAGSIFRGPEWVCVGWQKSERVSNHGRMIRVWRLAK